jgi:ABC-type uncharacterized transport system substrate-binding protein
MRDGIDMDAYGHDRVDRFRRAASYVDRILKGERSADLPVQAPTKYQLVLNLKMLMRSRWSFRLRTVTY